MRGNWRKPIDNSNMVFIFGIFLFISCLALASIQILLFRTALNFPRLCFWTLVALASFNPIWHQKSEANEVCGGFSSEEAGRIPKSICSKLDNLSTSIAQILELSQDKMRRQDTRSTLSMLNKSKKVVCQGILQMRRSICDLKKDTFLPAHTRTEMSEALHDGVIQELSAILMGVEYCEKLLVVNPARVREEMEELCKLALRLRTADISPFVFIQNDVRTCMQTLISAIECYINCLSNISQIEFNLLVDGREQYTSYYFRCKLLRIVQEALFNVCKHAQASQAQVKMTFGLDRLKVIIKDDGKGFVLESKLSESKSSSHLGLSEMHENAKSLGGTLHIETGPNKGTTIILLLPLKAGHPDEKNEDPHC